MKNARPEPSRRLLVVSHEWNLGFEELRQLADAGYQVIPATNGFDAVKQFATRPIDAVIVNRRLPDIDVADLVTYFRRHHPALPIVMVSSTMPVINVPPEIDAVIAKHNCEGLLASTLSSLSAPHVPHPPDSSLAQAA